MHRRSVFTSLEREKTSKKISVLIGPRQVGKTTLLNALHQELGGIYLDLDLYSNFERISNYERFLDTLKLEGYREDQKKTFFVFLDEFQHYADLSVVLKNIYDHHSNIKIYVTGSSSIGIKNRIQESLAGRKTITTLYPLNFDEFLMFKGQEEWREKIKTLKKIHSDHLPELMPGLMKWLEEFMVFGGYPEVVLAKTPEQKRKILAGIFDLYVKKDLVEYLKIEKIQAAKTLIELLSVNHGGIANYARFGQTAGLDTKTVISYIEILKETFLIQALRPYFKNKNKEIARAPKLYFIDNGVRNFFYNNFNPLRLRADRGALFESFYISELLKWGKDPESLKYYRTKSGSEVDLVIDLVSKIIPVELKSGITSTGAKDLQPLQTFMKEYKAAGGFLVSPAETGIAFGKIKKVDCFNVYF